MEIIFLIAVALAVAAYIANYVWGFFRKNDCRGCQSCPYSSCCDSKK